MSWNHRIVKKVDTSPLKSEEGFYYEIHEAYYNSKGELCAITENAITPYGESPEDLKLGLELMLTAFKHPVLIDGQIEYAKWDDDVYQEEGEEEYPTGSVDAPAPGVYQHTNEKDVLNDHYFDKDDQARIQQEDDIEDDR